MIADRFELDDRHNGRNGPWTGPPPGAGEYARLSRRIDALRAAEAGWAADLCEQLGLDPDVLTIGELLVHADKWNRSKGLAAFAREDLLRREGAVPRTATVHVDLEGQYTVLGARVREALERRGLGPEIAQAVHDAIIEAIEQTMDAEPGT